MEDAGFIRKLKNGDSQAVGALFDKYYDRIYGYCYRHVTHKETAQDLTQEVFLKAFKNLESYHHYGKFQNYLYVISRNLCKDFYKKKSLLSLEDMELQVEEEGFSNAENQLVVKEAMDKLPELEREIIYLRFYQDRKIKDIAQILGLKQSTTKYHLKKAQELLSYYLKE